MPTRRRVTSSREDEAADQIGVFSARSPRRRRTRRREAAFMEIAHGQCNVAFSVACGR
jgi:hypothetical protein